MYDLITEVSHETKSAFEQDQDGPARKLTSNLYDIHQFQVYSEWTPDDGQRNSPKHLEVHFLAKINLGNWRICWFYYKEIRYDARSHECKIPAVFTLTNWY
jgi:hypothetical protein